MKVARILLGIMSVFWLGIIASMLWIKHDKHWAKARRSLNPKVIRKSQPGQVARLITPELAQRIPVEWGYGKDFWKRVDIPPVPAFWINTHDPVQQDMFISASVHKNEKWDPYIWDLMVRVLNKLPGRIVIDVGANLGYFSLMAASLGFQVIAFEPMNRNMAKLVSSVTRNGWEDRIILYQNAVSDRSGHAVHMAETDVTNQGNGHITHMHWQAQGLYGQDYVETVRLDQVLSKENVALIKIDVEGQEGAVIKGAPNFLCKLSVQYIVLEFSDETKTNKAHPVHEWLWLLEKLGYDVSDIVPEAQRLSVLEWSMFPPNLLFTLQQEHTPKSSTCSFLEGMSL